MDLTTLQPAEFPDDTIVYVPGYGETTAGDVRGGVAKVEPDMLEMSAQMWSDIVNEDFRCRINGDIPRDIDEIKAGYRERWEKTHGPNDPEPSAGPSSQACEAGEAGGGVTVDAKDISLCPDCAPKGGERRRKRRERRRSREHKPFN